MNLEIANKVSLLELVLKYINLVYVFMPICRYSFQYYPPNGHCNSRFANQNCVCTFRRVGILMKSAYYLSHICPSVHIYQPGSHCTYIREI